MSWLTPSLDFFLQCRKGRIEGHNIYVMSGTNPSTGSTERPIWSADSEIYYPTSAEQLKVSSSDTNDTSAGTGARTVTIFGLNSLFETISETVTLNGQTAVTTTNSYLRVNGLKVVSSGSSNANEGTIYVGNGTVTSGVPADIVRLIDPGYNVCKCGYFTVPVRMTAFRVHHFFSNAGTAAAEFSYRIRGAGSNLWYSSGKIPIATGTTVFQNQASRGHSTGSDVEFRCAVASGTPQTTMFAEFILADSRSG